MAAMPPLAVDPLRTDALVDAPAGGCAGAARFALGPGTLLGAIGLLHRGDTTVAVPAVDWREARVDVLVCLRGGQATIVHCLAALHAQSLRPRRVRLVEDRESRDGSAVLAREFAKANRMAIEIVRAGGGDVLLREQAEQLDGDVLVVLDAHTVLDSRHYLERCVRALHDGAGIGSVCGGVLPLRDEDRRRWAATDAFRRWLGGDDWRDPARPRTAWGHAMRWLGDAYRECVGLVQQRIVQRGQMRAFGSICHPAGAVAYRRRALLQALSTPGAIDPPACGGPEEVPVGFALAHEGYRAVQVADAVARVHPPRLSVLVAQRMRYTRSFLLSAARYRALLRTPRRPVVAAPVPPAAELRRAAEPYRQPFGAERTHAFGRPVGWALVCTALDKVAVPAAVLALFLIGAWSWLAAALAVETGVWLALLALAAPHARIATLARGLVVAPLRYLEIVADAMAVARFIAERRSTRAPVLP